MYQLAKAFRLLDGEWLFESRFFSGEDFSSRVSKKTLEEIKANPNKYYLVEFDFHF